MRLIAGKEKRMDGGPESQSFLSQLLAWVAAGIAAIGAWLWVNTMGRIQRLEQNKIGREEFNTHIDRFAEDQRNRLATEEKLFDRLDDLKDLIIERTAK